MRQLHVAYLATDDAGRFAYNRSTLDVTGEDIPDELTLDQLIDIERKCLERAQVSNPSFTRACVQSWQWLRVS